MPSAVADWSQVKATAIHRGSLKEAAEAHGLNYPSVRMRASREEWPVGRRVQKTVQAAQAMMESQIIKASGGRVASVTSSAEAAEIMLKEGAINTRLDLTRYAARMAKQAGDAGLLEEAPLYKAVADIHGKMHPEVAEDHSTHLSFFSVSMDRPGEPSSDPVEHAIDITPVQPPDDY